MCCLLCVVGTLSFAFVCRRCSFSVVCGSLFVVRRCFCLLCVVFLVFVACSSLTVVRCLWIVVRCVLLVVCCMLYVVCYLVLFFFSLRVVR